MLSTAHTTATIENQRNISSNSKELYSKDESYKDENNQPIFPHKSIRNFLFSGNFNVKTDSGLGIEHDKCIVNESRQNIHKIKCRKKNYDESVNISLQNTIKRNKNGIEDAN